MKLPLGHNPTMPSPSSYRAGQLGRFPHRFHHTGSTTLAEVCRGLPSSWWFQNARRLFWRTDRVDIGRCSSRHMPIICRHTADTRPTLYSSADYRQMPTDAATWYLPIIGRISGDIRVFIMGGPWRFRHHGAHDRREIQGGHTPPSGL